MIICVGNFLAFKCLFIVFSKHIILLFIFVHQIRRLENSCLKPDFNTQYKFLFVWAGREYYKWILFS